MSRLLPLACLLVLGACGRFAPDRMAAVPAGFASHQLCAAVFLSGQDPKRYWATGAPPGMAIMDPFLRVAVDHEAQRVRTSLAGLGSRQDVVRGEAGCLTLRPGQPVPPAPRLAPLGPALLPEIAPPGDSPVAPASAALQAAADAAFAGPDLARETTAVVILHRGRVVAERYAPSFGPATRVEGWSSTKTVVNAALGILVLQGRLTMDAPAPVPEWRDPGDPRAAITPAQLLRMTGGIDFGDSQSVGIGDLVNPPTQMLYSGEDMGALAAAAPAAYPPGSRYRYSNGST
jgi:hypothetical protein